MMWRSVWKVGKLERPSAVTDTSMKINQIMLWVPKDKVAQEDGKRRSIARTPTGMEMSQATQGQQSAPSAAAQPAKPLPPSKSFSSAQVAKQKEARADDLPDVQPKGKTTSQPRLLKCLPPPPQPLAPNAMQDGSTGLFLQPCPHLPQSQMLRLIRMENFNCLENEGAENRTASAGVLVPNACHGTKKIRSPKSAHSPCGGLCSICFCRLPACASQ
ncbi:uncharacterized protein LOC115350130 [Aquila chrysaetos chrysaetos]|uniref:uncharacterized protein LOC115350130 n=1 Tax=Aquila chrysaetos chrysaetos TaxID=223781 RepID=UPI001B7D3AE0|nr:uncharacterized protein LOC115350130 [Aquila chrysaetos chrysaetos]